jgi:REP-associated tyrosine transposase
MNRGAKKAVLFENPGDYCAFEDLMAEARSRLPIRILAYCLMPNHWHLLLWPLADGDLTRFVQWLTMTHAVRWNRAHGTVGNGAVYQSRFKSIPIERGPHLFWAWRYVERNPLRANLVSRAEDWKWGSLWRRLRSNGGALDEGPLRLPHDWREIVNVPQTDAELKVFRHNVATGKPYGSERWLVSGHPRRGRPPLTRNEKRGSDPI